MKRAEAEKYAKELLGAKSTPKTISKATNMLVVGGDTNDTKSTKKLQNANKLGIKIINEDQFLEMIELAEKNK